MNILNTQHRFPHFLAAALASLMLAAAPLSSSGQTFSEPHTVFYGKVLGTASIQPFLVTTGKLAWTIQRADGTTVTLETSLFSFHEDTFSYRLHVPHSAFALGLSANGHGIPLPPVPQINLHAAVSVDGQTAALLGPAGSTFTTEQLLRTATYRMDLGLNRAAADTDGDGIPDWWEDRYGLDKQNPGDAGVDANGDGLSALDAYRRGLDPALDARHPAIVTRDVVVYPAGTTALSLDVADIDSSPAQLTFELKTLPHAGTISKRHAAPDAEQPDLALAPGATFTLADMLSGRIVYDHDGSASAPGFFMIAVRDEQLAHPTNEATIHLLAFEPTDLVSASPDALEQRRLDHHYYAGLGAVIHDGSSLNTNSVLSTPSAGVIGPALAAYLAAYGDDRSYVVSGSRGGASSITGGHRDDVLMAGPDGGMLTGGEGADWFVVSTFNRGQVVVTDFQPALGDGLDLSSIPAAPGGFVHQYLRFSKTGSVNRIQVDLDGNGAGFTNLAIALPGLTDAEADLYQLVESGRLLVGSLALEPMVSIAATQPQASENGGTPGSFTITRRGSLDADLTIQLGVSGSAQNGVDYQFIPGTVVMPSGIATLAIPVTPYPDSQMEPTETVQVALVAGAGYRVGTPTTASVSIEDLLMLVEIEAVDAVAVKQDGIPATFMITRRDVINRDVVIRLTISGTASNGVDYNTLSSLVYMAPNQTVAFLTVTPKTNAQLAGGLETVSISIRPDAQYRVSGAGSASGFIIERSDSFAGWRIREFPDATGDNRTFASGDSDATGITHFERYAFGLDPQAPDASGLPRPIVVDGKLVVTFLKPVGVQDVQYRVAGATDLMQWGASSVGVSPASLSVGGDEPNRVYFEVDASYPAAFIVVEAEWVP